MHNLYIPFSAYTYKARRQTLSKAVAAGKIFLYGNNYSAMNFKDNTYHFKQDSSFLYYIGINLPGLHAIIDTGTGTTTLYGDDVGIDMIIWTGEQEKLASLAERTGIENVKPSNSLQQDLSISDHYLPPYRAAHEVLLHKLFSDQKIDPSEHLIKAVVQQRNIKSEEEIQQMDIAASLTGEMHRTVMQAARPGMKEYELVSIANQVAWKHNCQWSFPPIMTVNGETLHNHYYGNELRDGDLLLYDGGIEAPSGYAGDMTRTFPVSGFYSELQKSVYSIVKSGYEQAVELCKSGSYFRDIHLATARKMSEGLKELGWMKGNIDEAVAAGAHTLFFQHGLGHMLGLDVHDMENLGEEYVGYTEDYVKSTDFGLRSLRLGKQLETGNVFTIEPGIYLIPQLIVKFRAEGKFKEFINYDKVWENKNFGGIRLEDDYVLESNGVRKLGYHLTIDIQEIERIRKGSS
jgi:Xaa-Pro aminopeptidase